MDEMNWGNQPQYHSQQPRGHYEDAAPTIPGQPVLSSDFARDRDSAGGSGGVVPPGQHRAMRWTAGIIAAVVLAGGGAIAGMELSSGSSPAQSSASAPLSAAPSDSGQAAALSAVLNAAGSTAGPGEAVVGARHIARALRRLRGVHGEFTVRKRGGGFAEIAFERGTVVSRSGTSVVVRAADGTAWTWTLTSDTVVRKDRAKSSASALSAGDLVFAAGTESGSVRDARLIIARDKKAPGGSQGSSSSSTSQS